jgi:hypothetical protein
MAIQFACSCGRKLQAADEHAGRRVKCPACGAEMTVPGDGTAVQPAEAVPSKPASVQAEEPPPPAADDERDEDRPRRPRRKDDEDDDRPRRRGRDDEEEDDRPRRRRRREDDEDDDEEYERPRRSGETSGKATAALVLGLLSFCFGILAALPAVILGIVALVEISRGRGRLGGKGAAIAGMILGGVGLVAVPVLLVFAVQRVREAAANIQDQNNLKQMGLAMHNYNDTYGHLPEAMPDPKLRGKTKLSWRVELLPYVEEDMLYRQFHHDEPWDSPNNKQFLTAMPKVFAHPEHPVENAQGLTYYRVFVGEHTPFPPGQVSSIPRNFPDGTSNTILIIEAADPVPWTKPDELVYDPKKPLPRLGGHFRQGTNAALADASVVPLRIGNGLSERTLRSAIDPNDGLPLGADWP